MILLSQNCFQPYKDLQDAFLILIFQKEHEHKIAVAECKGQDRSAFAFLTFHTVHFHDIWYLDVPSYNPENLRSYDLGGKNGLLILPS